MAPPGLHYVHTPSPACQIRFISAFGTCFSSNKVQIVNQFGHATRPLLGGGFGVTRQLSYSYYFSFGTCFRSDNIQNMNEIDCLMHSVRV